MDSTELKSAVSISGNSPMTPEEWSMFEALLSAAREGRAEDLRSLLQTARNTCSHLGVERYNGIAYAATMFKHDPRKTLQILLDYGWDFNMPSSWIDPPSLGNRRVICDEPLVQWFLDNGANPDAPAAVIDITPLSVAVQYAPLRIVELLFERGGTGIRGQLANYATQRPLKDLDALPILQLLYDKGVPVDNIIFEDHPTSQSHLFARTTPLMNACLVGNVEMVQFLIKHGANPRRPIWVGDKTSIGTELPIDLARQNGHTKIVKILATAMKKEGSHI